MKKTTFFVAGLLLLVSGCGGSTAADDDKSNESASSTIQQPIGSVKFTPDAGRLLASQCYQCHGTNGISVNKWDSIAGEDNLHKEMFEDDELIMLKQAKGYTDQEITSIEKFLSTLSKGKEDDDEKDDD